MRSLPTSKTGAAIRKQAPVIVANLLAAMRRQTASSRYDGCTSCPLVTARSRMLLAESTTSSSPPQHPARQHHEAAVRHVAAQALRPARPLLAGHAQRPQPRPAVREGGDSPGGLPR